jgi:hypothetical protein
MDMQGLRVRGRSTMTNMLTASVVVALGAWGCALSPEEADERVVSAETALEQGEPGIAAGPFAITLSDETLRLGLDDFDSVLVDVEPLEGFTGDVTLAVTSEPPLAGEASIFPSVVTPGEFFEAFLDISTACETTPGDYTLTVTGTGDDGAAESAAVLLTVETTDFPPSAGFFVDRDGFTVQFIDTSFAGGCGFSAEIVEWLWDFGDGTTSTEENPTHTYAARGDYTVSLTVTNDEGASDTTTSLLTVLPPPPVLSIFRIARDPTRFEFRVDLRWSGAEGDLVELRRNGTVVNLPDNDGAHRDRFRSTQTSFRWEICELGIFFCSNEVSVDFGPNLADDLATVTTTIDGENIVETVLVVEEKN